MSDLVVEKIRKYRVQAELERNILRGLACEWHQALDVLSSSQRMLMREPVFSLKDMLSKWGYWSAAKNEICLSRQLVLNHPWDSVREVLLHEMAHQLAENVLGAPSSPPHGSLFKEACHFLRANPAASGSYPLLHERICKNSLNLRDKMLQRVQKLLALAESQNRHEAEAAMLKAHELMAKYNLKHVKWTNNSEFVSVFIGKPALRHHREDYYLASLLIDFYFVHGIWIPAYVLEKDKMGRVMEISGTKQNVAIADYVHNFIVSFVDRRWLAYNQSKRLNRRRKTDFAIGIIRGFRSKIETQTWQRIRSEKKLALARIPDQRLDAYLSHKYPRTVTLSKKALHQDRRVIEAGIKLGERLVIAKGIPQKKREQIYLLPSDSG